MFCLITLASILRSWLSVMFRYQLLRSRVTIFIYACARGFGLRSVCPRVAQVERLSIFLKWT